MHVQYLDGMFARIRLWNMSTSLIWPAMWKGECYAGQLYLFVEQMSHKPESDTLFYTYLYVESRETTSKHNGNISDKLWMLIYSLHKYKHNEPILLLSFSHDSYK